MKRVYGGYQLADGLVDPFNRADQVYFNRFGQHIPIISGYRDPAQNRAVGGALHSDHLTGSAFDINRSAISQATPILKQFGLVPLGGTYFNPATGQTQPEDNHFMLAGNHPVTSQPAQTPQTPGAVDMAPMPQRQPYTPLQTPKYDTTLKDLIAAWQGVQQQPDQQINYMPQGRAKDNQSQSPMEYRAGLQKQVDNMDKGFSSNYPVASRVLGALGGLGLGALLGSAVGSPGLGALGGAVIGTEIPGSYASAADQQQAAQQKALEDKVAKYTDTFNADNAYTNRQEQAVAAQNMKHVQQLNGQIEQAYTLGDIKKALVLQAERNRFENLSPVAHGDTSYNTALMTNADRTKSPVITPKALLDLVNTQQGIVNGQVGNYNTLNKAAMDAYNTNLGAEQKDRELGQKDTALNYEQQGLGLRGQELGLNQDKFGYQQGQDKITNSQNAEKIGIERQKASQGNKVNLKDETQAIVDLAVSEGFIDKDGNWIPPSSGFMGMGGKDPARLKRFNELQQAYKDKLNQRSGMGAKITPGAQNYLQKFKPNGQ